MGRGQVGKNRKGKSRLETQIRGERKQNTDLIKLRLVN